MSDKEIAQYQSNGMRSAYTCYNTNKARNVGSTMQSWGLDDSTTVSMYATHVKQLTINAFNLYNVVRSD